MQPIGGLILAIYLISAPLASSDPSRQVFAPTASQQDARHQPAACPFERTQRHNESEGVLSLREGMRAESEPNIGTLLPSKKSPPQSGSRLVNTEKWRYKYIDELAAGFQLKILERSLDARLANSLYTTHSTRLVNFDAYKFHSGDAAEDERLVRAVAGPKVDDRLCGRQLGETLALVEDLMVRLKAKRQNESVALNLSERDIRLAHHLDSFGRYESGHLLGKTFAPGSFEQCQNTKLLLPASGKELVGTRFCWARLNLEKHLDKALRRRERSPLEVEDNVLSTGVCLPQSCHSKSFYLLSGEEHAMNGQQLENRRLVQKLVDLQFKLPDSMYLDESVAIASVFCPVDEGAHFGIPPSGKLLFAFVALWLAAVGYSTWTINGKSAEECGAKKEEEAAVAATGGLLQCLDLRQSWSEFICEKETVRASKGRVELDTLNPIKVVGCLFVIMGHSLIASAAIAMNGLAAYKLVEDDPLLLATVVGTVIVDTFFVITGILMGFIAMRRKSAPKAGHKFPSGSNNDGSHHQGNNKQGAVAESGQERRNGGSSLKLAKMFFREWFKFSATRHLRLVPLFFLVFWFKKSVFIYWMTHLPFWDSGFNRFTELGACKQESWTTPFGFMSALLPLNAQCLPQSWSLSTDLFFSLFIPPILILFTRKPKLAILLSCAVSFISIAWAHQTVLDIDPSLLEELLEMRSHGFALVFGNLAYIYTYPHFRFCSILVGVIAGYILFQYNSSLGQEEEEEGKPSDWPAWFKGPVTNAAIGLEIAIFVTVAFIPTVKSWAAPHHRQSIPHLLSSGRLVWALSNAIIFLRMTTDWRRSFLMRFNSGKFWRVAVKLNLATLLVHMDFLLLIIATQTSNLYFNKMTVFTLFSTTFVFSIPTALFLHVVFENPIDKLVKRYVLPKL